MTVSKRLMIMLSAPVNVKAPAKENAQNTRRIVLIIENIPPRFSRRGTSAIMPSLPCGNIVMLNPSIKASSPCLMLSPCMTTPRIRANTHALSIKGMTGFLRTAPHNTITGGKIRMILKWYSDSRALTISVTRCGVATSPSILLWPAIR